jgi:hypothetical protein
MLPSRAIVGLPLVQVALGAIVLIVASLFGVFVPLDNAGRAASTLNSSTN